MDLRQFTAETCSDEQLTSGEDQVIYIKARNMNIIIAELTPLSGSFFERQLDETSVAEIYAIADTAECCGALDHVFLGQEIEWWVDHELQWAGIINFINWQGTAVNIKAADFTSMWAVRHVHNINMPGSDASDVVVAIHEEAMREEPFTSFELLVRRSGEPVAFQTYDNEWRTAKDLIDELAEYAIDYSAYGRKILVGSEDFFPEFEYPLTDEDFVEAPSIEARGAPYGFATRIIARGSSGLFHEETAPSQIMDIYGLIERVINYDNLTSQKDLIRAAKSALELYSSPYYINLSDTDPELRLGANISRKALIPGMKIQFQSTSSCKKISMLMRLLKMRHEATGKVNVSLEPVGSINTEPVTSSYQGA